MKKLLLSFIALSVLLLPSCKSGQKMVDLAAPEEQGLNIQKITDENANSVLGGRTYGSFRGNFALSRYGGCKEAKYYWSTGRFLAMSPSGTEIAYLNRANKQDNIMVRNSGAIGTATQRTFRDVYGFSWGQDGNLYFSDASDGDNRQIAATSATSGSIIRQLTNSNIDDDPVISTDGKLLLFTRIDKMGPMVWSLNLEDNSLTSCARGYNPVFIGDSKDEFVCVRNSSAGVSEIWRVNYVKGQETVILSDKNRGFSNPVVSPDGQWLLVEGNSKSSQSKKQNLDIFAVKLDGSNFTQITYHVAIDCCPTWSKDGKYIYFLSTRGNKDEYYNVWCMRFAL